MKKQVYNPYLPSYEYIPDGEPHVFGDRLYLYGSHDRCGSAGFCLNDYVCYSADVKDLTEWKYEGVIYRKEQDPRNQNIPKDAPEQTLMFGIKPQKEEDLNPRGIHAMWAPDVACGPDGRYYLYYCLDFLPEIGVAVCDTPAGEYQFLGFVRHTDGTVLGRADGDMLQFDPGVFIDKEDIWLYSGNAQLRPEYARPDQASQVMRLETDMVTLKEEPRKLMPGVLESAGSGFEGHEFFEASSVRKVGDTYYFVYSSVKSSELCYAVSKYPDREYHYGGTLVDIGDIGMDGRTAENAVNALGNTHGGIEQVNGQWYVFYHRQTNRTNFSRQGCAEKIVLKPDGTIAQAEVTSCGLNDGALSGKGTYPARICCHLTGKAGAVFSHPEDMKEDFPYLSQDLPDIEPDSPEAGQEEILPVQYVKNIQNGTVIGYKYFHFEGTGSLTLKIRGSGKGVFEVSQSLHGDPVGRISAEAVSKEWMEAGNEIAFRDGVHPLYLKFIGSGTLDLVTFLLE